MFSMESVFIEVTSGELEPCVRIRSSLMLLRFEVQATVTKSALLMYQADSIKRNTVLCIWNSNTSVNTWQ